MNCLQNHEVQKLSRFISNVFHPIISLLLFFVYLGARRLSWQEAAEYMMPILLIVILPIIFWIFYHVKKGNYSNADVSDRGQRKTLYYFIISTLLVYLGYYYLRFNVLDDKMFYLFVLLGLMNLSNYFIKSSMHTGLNVFAAGLFYSECSIIGIFWLILTGMIGLSRWILKRHTTSEVFSGAGIGVLVSILYLYSQK